MRWSIEEVRDLKEALVCDKNRKPNWFPIGKRGLKQARKALSYGICVDKTINQIDKILGGFNDYEGISADKESS